MQFDSNYIPIWIQFDTDSNTTRIQSNSESNTTRFQFDTTSSIIWIQFKYNSNTKLVHTQNCFMYTQIFHIFELVSNSIRIGIQLYLNCIRRPIPETQSWRTSQWSIHTWRGYEYQSYIVIKNAENGGWIRKNS